MRIRFWETNRSSYAILELVVTMMKLTGALAILGIDATMQRIGRRMDRIDETADVLVSARRG